ncbi:lactonase family protein [Lactobacillus hominis]|uniref:lactonase family protein n=1 Tax=Lactobacillus hominis TaxID=1203033 RepID=UPI0023F03B90|nr:lactonase family protein [Lactobacillus hominis]
MKILFGGYTSHDSKGIYQGEIDLNSQTPEVTNVQNIIEIQRPTYFQVNQDRDLLFSIDQPDSENAGIASFHKNAGKYTEVSTYLHPGAAPCYVGINTKKQLLYTANYHLGTANVFSYDDQGNIKFIASTKHTGKGPRPEQDSAHIHYFDQTPAGHLVTCDLGTDSVDFYDLKDDQLVHLAQYQMEKGFGTRHITFSPDGKLMFIVGELSSQVNVAKLNEDTWEFESIATYKTIPEDFKEHNGAAAILISKDGKFIYVTNRGNDSIAVFRVLADGHLDLVQRISVFGSFPRDFNWDPSQTYLVAANQNTNNATLYRRNSKDGTLTPIQKNILVPEATRVLFTEK